MLSIEPDMGNMESCFGMVADFETNVGVKVVANIKGVGNDRK